MAQLKSVMGTICTAIWVCIILFFAINKFDILIGRKATNILSATREMHFSSKDEFDSKQGLSIAVGFTAYDNEQTWSLDPSYGELVINTYEWGLRDDGSPYTDRQRLETHNCTREELTLEEGEGRSSSGFYPIIESNRHVLDLYWRKMVCINAEDARIYGDFNSIEARQINI